jgi:hypothetical protein
MAPDCCYTPSAGGGQICTGPQRTNFSYWLYQKDELPGGRSVAFTVKGDPNVPSLAQSDVYGYHTARRTDQASGNNFMYFDLDDEYRPSLASGSNFNWEVTATFVNKGSDKLSLEYVDKDGQNIKQSITKGSALGQVDNWVDYKWTLTDADFLNNKMNGADFRINAEGDGDEIFHRVIVKPIFFTSGFGGGGYAPTPTPTGIPADASLNLKAAFQGALPNQSLLGKLLARVSNSVFHPVLVNRPTPSILQNLSLLGLSLDQGYDFVLSSIPFLSNKRSLVIRRGINPSATEALDFGTLRTGDLNGDDQINGLDWSLMKTNFGQSGEE